MQFEFVKEAFEAMKLIDFTFAKQRRHFLVLDLRRRDNRVVLIECACVQ